MLFTSAEFAVPLQLRSLFGVYLGGIQLPLDEALAGGFSVFAQAIFADLASNSLGLVLSSALECRIASNFAFAPARALYGVGQGAKVGQDLRTDQRICIAVRLEGAFN